MTDTARELLPVGTVIRTPTGERWELVRMTRTRQTTCAHCGQLLIDATGARLRHAWAQITPGGTLRAPRRGDRCCRPEGAAVLITPVYNRK